MAKRQNFDEKDPYLRQLCNHPILSAKEERELLDRYHLHDDLAARNRLITCNQRLIVRIIRRRVPGGIIAQVGIHDLVQDGNVGLAIAIDKFDFDRKSRLTTYASWWIRSYVQRGSMEKAQLVGVNHRKSRERRQQVREENRVFAITGEPLVDETLSYQSLAVTRGLARTVDIDSAVSNPNGEVSMRLADIISNGDESIDDEVGRDDLKRVVRQRLAEFRSTLKDTRDWAIIERRLMADVDDVLTLDELGKMFGVSRERIRQLEERLIPRLRVLLSDLT